MTEAEIKANEILKKYFNEFTNHMQWKEAKECALFHVEGMIEALNYQKTYTAHKLHTEKFLEEVKQAIKNSDNSICSSD